MGYNIKRDGSHNIFTDENNILMKEDGVPWRGTVAHLSKRDVRNTKGTRGTPE
jgi:hypothetical protein